MNTVALLLPGYLPNLYYLAAMMQADRVVLVDNERFSRKSRVHRGRIRTPAGTQWLTIPVDPQTRRSPVNRVGIDHSRDWVRTHLRALEYNYRNSIYFDFYEPEIRADLQQARQYTYLIDFVLYFKRRLLTYLQIDVTWELASEQLDYDPDPDRFIGNMGAGAMFQEQYSRHYQRQGSRRREPEFRHPVYIQHFKGFESDCCLLDVLFQYGPSAYEIIDPLAAG